MASFLFIGAKKLWSYSLTIQEEKGPSWGTLGTTQLRQGQGFAAALPHDTEHTHPCSADGRGGG